MKNTLSTKSQNPLFSLINSCTEFHSAAIKCADAKPEEFPLQISGLKGSLPSFFIRQTEERYRSLLLPLVRSCRFSATIRDVRKEDIPQEHTACRKENLVLRITARTHHNFKRDKPEVDNLQKGPHTIIRLGFIPYRFAYTQRRPETELHLLHTRFGLVLGILGMRRVKEQQPPAQTSQRTSEHRRWE